MFVSVCEVCVWGRRVCGVYCAGCGCIHEGYMCIRRVCVVYVHEGCAYVKERDVVGVCDVSVSKMCMCYVWCEVCVYGVNACVCVCRVQVCGPSVYVWYVCCVYMCVAYEPCYCVWRRGERGPSSSKLREQQ